MVWSNDEVQKLTNEFVAVADELHELRTGKSLEANFFQAVFDQKKKHPGHQGVFLATPSGRLLASSTCYEPGKVIALLNDGLKAWSELSTQQRLEPTNDLVNQPTGDRPEDSYPVDGLALRVTARDLPGSRLDGERNSRWHRYYLWLSREEVESFLQTEYQPGQEIKIPANLASRVACLSLLDKGLIDGFTKPFREADVEKASLTMKVTTLSDTEVQFQIFGLTATKTTDAQAFVSNLPKYEEIPKWRGVTTKIIGSATLDKKSNKFVKFQMVAAGTRFGGAYIGRTPEDWGEHPIGFSFVMGESAPAEKIAPEFPHRYPWLN